MHLHQELEGFYLGSASHFKAMPSPSIGMAPRLPKIRNGNPPSATSHEKKITRNSASRKVLLLLEDFDKVRSYLVRNLSDREYDIFSAATLRDALAIAFEQLPEVIVIDAGLHGDTIFHAITRLNDAFPQTKLILVGDSIEREYPGTVVQMNLKEVPFALHTGAVPAQ